MRKPNFISKFGSVAAVLAIIGLAGPSVGYAAEDKTKLESNKTAVKQYKQSQWSDDAAMAEKDLFSPDFNLVRAEFQNLVTNAEDPKLSAMAQPLSEAIPDRVDTVEEIVAEGDTVGIVYRIKGTHSGNLYGIPATGKPIDIQATAFYRFDGDKIVEGWTMADEGALLLQLGQWLPERSDGKSIAPKIMGPTRDGNDVLAEAQTNSDGSQPHVNKILVAAYKSANPPEGLLPAEGRPYGRFTRSGFFHMASRAKELGVGDKSIGKAYPDRRDQIGIILTEGDKVMMQFLLSGTNTESLFGFPASGKPVQAWEVGLQHFEGGTWETSWWFGDDVGMLLQLEAPGNFLIPDSM